MKSDLIEGTFNNSGELDDLGLFAPVAVEDPSLLNGRSLASFLAWLAFRRASGTLFLVDETSKSMTVTVKDGSLATLERDSLPFIDEVMNNLVSNDVISAEAGAEAQANSDSGGKSTLQNLFESGACTPRALVDAIRITKQGLVNELLGIPKASFKWQAGVQAIKASDPVTIDLNLFLVKLVRERGRSAYYTELELYLHDFMGRYPLKSDILTPAISGVALTDKERRVLDEIADGSITLKEVISLSLLSRNMTARMFFFCCLLGFVEFRKLPLPKGGIEALETELKKIFDRVKGEDHFARLEIHWTSHPNRISPGYEKMRKRYGPLNMTRRQSMTASELADSILALMEESRNVLIDQEARRSYRHEIMDDTKLVFGTDFLFKQAHLAKFRGDIGKAREIIESAIDILPTQKFVNFRRSLG